jgi:hypothetical protein
MESLKAWSMMGSGDIQDALPLRNLKAARRCRVAGMDTVRRR